MPQSEYRVNSLKVRLDILTGLRHLISGNIDHTENRAGLDIEQVATGEYWLASKALELKLVDELSTSDDYLHSKMEESFDVIEICTVEERKPLERLLQQGTQLFQRVLQSRLPLPDSQPLDVREYYR